jgi:hypothetical protein
MAYSSVLVRHVLLELTNHQLIGGNILRVLSAVEQEALRLQSASLMERVIYPNSTSLEQTCRSPPESIPDEEDDQ